MAVASSQQDPDPPNDNNNNNNTSQSATTPEKPPWSELKTKAGKARKRLPLACIACRRKKIRCSGEKPACKRCSRSRIPCVYKVTTRKAAPRTDYMSMLDRRLKRMEERVIRSIPPGEARDMAAIGRSQVRPPPPEQPSSSARAAKAAQRKRSADEAFAAKLDAWLRNMRNDLHSDGSAPPAIQPRRSSKGSETPGLLTEGAEFLPPKEIQEHLCEVFFECVYGQSYLLLHKPSFMRRLKAGTVPPVLILAICAVSARFSTHPDINSEPAFLRGEEWARPASAIALRRHDEPNITILTVFLLLGLHEFGTCHGGRSWSFGGQALRMAYALQLHRELDREHPGQSGKLSCTDREIRRRTMWACFLMDRYNSSGSQRPPIGNERFIRIQLPIKESHFLMEIPGPTEDLDGDVPNPVPEGQGLVSNPKENMGVSAYIIRAIVVWGHIVDYLNLGGKKKDPYPLWSPSSGYFRLTKEINDFTSSLPSDLVFSYDNLQNHAAERIANQFIFLHIIINQNILFLNQFAIPLAPGARPPRDMPAQFLSDAGRAAVEAAHSISMLIEQAQGYSLTVPFAGYCAYSASTVHIWGIFSGNAQLEARSRDDLRFSYRYLNKMKRYWGMFHYMVESAKDRYRQFADAALRGPPRESSSQENSRIFQYGDWFDKFPHGLSLSNLKDSNQSSRTVSNEYGEVMRERADRQSVEEFFASLSTSPGSTQPPKQQQQQQQQQSRKRARGDSKSSAMQGLSMSRFPSSVGTTTAATPTITTTTAPQQPDLTLPMLNTVASQFLPNGNSPASFTNSNHNEPSLYTAGPSPQQNPPSLGFDATPTTTGALGDHLPQLDRHLVFGAYAGADPSTLISGDTLSMSLTNAQQQQQQQQQQPVMDGTSAGLWADPYSPTGGGGDFFQQQPSAWFLPFNLDPLAGMPTMDHVQSGSGQEALHGRVDGANSVHTYQ
ncbi:hypothetical protein VTN31DRAFT_5287 [Thermomyces dupontii]|uniref:uncharacterized protein n=1 Tax=Talaromyces thermophilus TaxID=28565 RepID=UPI0037422EB1